MPTVPKPKKATLYGPNGQKRVVIVGSSDAKHWQSQGWGLTAGSYKPPQGATPKATPTAPDSAAIDKILVDLGLSSEIIRGLSPDQKSMFAAVGQAIQGQYNQNKTIPQTFTPDDLNRILAEAQKDPNIDQFYKEQLRVGGADFNTAVTSLAGDYNAVKAENERQFGYQNKALTEQEAAAGRAYSGFRQQAQERLKSDQSAVIQSSRRDLQKSLTNLGSGFEKTFGTSSLPGATIDGISYNPIGGIAGSMEQSKLGDIRNREQDIRAREALSRGF